MSSTRLVSIVIPVFNEAESVPVLLQELSRMASTLESAVEVVFVDDGSTDGSDRVLADLASSNESVRVVRLARNQGQSAALAAGFRRARGEVIVTLDADLQNDPADIPRALALLADCDVVSGVRVNRRDDWVRRWSSRIANGVRRRLLHDGVTDVGCSLKAYRAEMLRDLPEFKGMHRFLPALVQLKGARVREMPVHHRARVYGQAKYGIGNRLWRGLADLMAVRWLRSRWIDPSLESEVTRIGAGALADPGREETASDPSGDRE